MNKFIKLMVLTAITTSGLLQSAQKQTVTILNKSSYDMHIGLAGESFDALKPLGIGREDREIELPMIINNQGEWDRVDLKVRVSLIESKRGDNYIKQIKKTIPLYAPKGGFANLKTIEINYSKIFTLSKNGKFSLKFDPSDLGISYKK